MTTNLSSHRYGMAVDIYTGAERERSRPWACKTLWRNNISVPSTADSPLWRTKHGHGSQAQRLQYRTRLTTRPMKRRKDIQNSLQKSDGTVTYPSIPTYPPVEDFCTNQDRSIYSKVQSLTIVQLIGCINSSCICWQKLQPGLLASDLLSNGDAYSNQLSSLLAAFNSSGIR